jgi:hypothetical protein
VAIKLPIAGLKDGRAKGGEDILRRFAKEARAAARLRHPNIVAVFDHGEAVEGVYIVYEYVPGRTLADLIRQNDEPLTMEQAIEWIAVLADAISYAAGEGIVHRDIKPANIMIDPHGRPQMMDFGLAEVLEGGVAATGGKIAGTPVYMSPEQASGATQIDSASDQYGLAAILYELVTGTRPVVGTGLAAISEVAQRDHPPLEPLKPLPIDLQRIILKAMRQTPRQRYSDCRDFASDLRAYLSGRPVTANPPWITTRLIKWAKRNRATAAAVFASGLLLVAVAVGSSVAALIFKKQRSELAFALASEESALRRASRNATLAKEQQTKAEAAAELAKINQRRAEAEAFRAREALAREVREREQRQLAEEKASAEADRRRKADVAARLYEDQLNESEQKNRGLKYAASLAKASGQILRGETSEAVKTLQQCDPSDRGWEWYWLRKKQQIETDFVPSADVDEKLVAALKSPSAWSSRYPLDFPARSREFVAWDWTPTRQVYFGWRGERALVISPEQAGRPGAAFATIPKTAWVFCGPKNHVLPLGTQIGELSGMQFASSEIVCFRRTVKGSFNRPEQRTFEVWNLSEGPRRITKQPSAGYAFVPSSIVVPQRQALIIATDTNTLTTRALSDGALVRRTEVDFDIASGPNALQLTAEGDLIICVQNGRFYVVSMEDGSVREGRSWGDVELADRRLLWDRTRRYLAISSPQKLSAPIVDHDPPPTLTSSWDLVDAATERKIATLQMPLSEQARVEVEESIGNRTRTIMHWKRQALPIVRLEVAVDQSTIAVCDASGGVWGWRRLGNPFGLPEKKQHGFPEPVTLAARDQHLLVGTDGVKIMLEVSDPADQNARSKQLKRRRAGKVTDLAVDAKSNRVATLDENGFTTIFQDGRQTCESPLIAGARNLEFIERGELLVIGTEQNELITIDTETGQVKRRTTAHAGAVTAVVHAVGHQMIVSAGQDRLIRLWDTETGQAIPIADTFSAEQIESLCFDRTSSRLVTCGGRSLAIYRCDREQLNLEASTVLPHDVDQAIFFDGAKRILAVGDRTGTLLRVRDGRPLFTLPSQTEQVVLACRVDEDPWLMTSDGASVLFEANR